MKFNGQLYGGAKETTDSFLYTYLYSHMPPGFFIECGALNGASISNCKILEDYLGWSGLNIEPSFAFNELILNRPKSINIKAALGDVDYKIVKFNESATNYAVSSFNQINPEHNNNTVEVPIYTYKNLLSILGIKKVDFFSLDVEGFEINVLDGMIGSEALPTYLFIETHISDRDTLYKKLSQLGYERIAYFHIDELWKLPNRWGPTDVPSFY